MTIIYMKWIDNLIKKKKHLFVLLGKMHVGHTWIYFNCFFNEWLLKKYGQYVLIWLFFFYNLMAMLTLFINFTKIDGEWNENMVIIIQMINECYELLKNIIIIEEATVW